jgi:hypothetical protein
MRNFFSIVILIAVFSCVRDKELCGSISETDTGCSIEGLVRHTGGNEVVNAVVLLHDQKQNTRAMLSKRSVLIRSGKTRTNSKGFFRIDSIDIGRYLVEIIGIDALSAIVPADVNENDTLIRINSLIGRCGSIKGKINTSMIMVGQGNVIYLPEIHRTAAIDSTGDFFVPFLPAWNYQLLIAVRDSIIKFPADTSRIPVVGGDTTCVISFGSKTGSILIHGGIIEQPNN